MLTTIYQHEDTYARGYKGIKIDAKKNSDHIKEELYKSLIDIKEKLRYQTDLEDLKGSIEQTGFNAPEELLVDIQKLNNPKPEDTRSWRIGESIAELILEKEYGVRFYWNELRDARNPSGNKTGADLVGFIELKGQILFLFGETKTSSEIKRPPQVMTKSDGMENQLRNLYSDRKKQQILIQYLASKTRNLATDAPFKKDYKKALQHYYKPISYKYQLFGVLVRDNKPDKEDLSHSYTRLKSDILDPAGLRLLAVYMPVEKKEWAAMINNKEQK